MLCLRRHGEIQENEPLSYTANGLVFPGSLLLLSMVLFGLILNFRARSGEMPPRSPQHRLALVVRDRQELRQGFKRFGLEWCPTAWAILEPAQHLVGRQVQQRVLRKGRKFR